MVLYVAVVEVCACGGVGGAKVNGQDGVRVLNLADFKVNERYAVIVEADKRLLFDVIVDAVEDVRFLFFKKHQIVCLVVAQPDWLRAVPLEEKALRIRAVAHEVQNRTDSVVLADKQHIGLHEVVYHNLADVISFAPVDAYLILVIQ